MQSHTAITTPSAFGRRRSARTVDSNGPGRSGITFETRYSWRVNWVAFVVLAMALSSARDLMSPESPGLKVIPLTSFDPLLMWAGTGIMAAIGLAWLWKGISRGRALTMTLSEVKGFTLLGTKSIKWPDVDRLQLKKHDTYGTELIIHAKRSSPSGSIWLNCIPVAVNSVDRSVEEIVSAIQVHRPDLHV